MVAVTVSPSLPMHSDSDTITQSEILDLLSEVSLLSSDSSAAPSCDASQPSLPSQCPEPSEDQPKPRSKSKRSKSSNCKKDNSTSRVSFSQKHKKFLRKLMSRSKRRSSDDTFVFSVGRNDDSSGSLAIGTLDTATSCRSTSLGSIPESEAIELPLPKFVKIGRRKRLSKRLKEFLTGLSKSRKAESKSRKSLDVPCRKDSKKKKSFSQRISKISFKKRSTKKCTDDCSDESSVGTVVSFSRVSGTMPRPVPAVSGTVSFSKVAGTMPTTVPYITSSTLKETDEVESEEEEAFEVSFTPAPVPVPQVPQVVSVTPKEKDEDEATGVYFTESFFSFVSFPDFVYAPQALLAPAASPQKKKKCFNYKKRSSDSVVSDLSVSTPELPIDTEERTVPVAATTKSLKKPVVRRNFLRTLIILLIGFGASYLMATSTHPMHVLQLKKPVALKRADSKRGSKRFLVFSDIYSNFANDVDMSDDEESEEAMFVRFEAEKFTRFEI